MPSQSPPLTNLDFYECLPTFSDFSDLDNNEHYRTLPSDWFVVITDITNSTQAIDNGLYKEINTLGAASISVLQQALGTFNFPFVFGGDGATALIHSKNLDATNKALVKLKGLARAQYDMDLRVGVVSVQELHDAGKNVEVAKYKINPHRSIAIIRGGGLSWADNRIKVDSAKYCLPESTEITEDLTNLSCRWHPIRAKRGKIVSLLVLPAGDDPKVSLKTLIFRMKKIFDGELNAACPIHIEKMNYKSFWGCLKDEWKYSGQHLTASFFRRVLSVLVSVLAFKLNLPLIKDREKYVQSLLSHSDYRKFDDILRMVLDCTNQEVDSLQSLLQDLYQEKRIFFGLHFSDHSLMTCLVENLSDGGHLHFIDGGDGGYTAAAKKLKQQLQIDKESKFNQVN